jgi:hypothetical protein
VQIVRGGPAAACLDRKGLEELGEPRSRPAIKDPLDDTRSEQRKAQDAGHVRPADSFGVGQIGERAELATSPT